jgi:hypothetical protein
MNLIFLGALIGAGIMWVATIEQRRLLKRLRTEHAELTRLYGQSTWADKSVLDVLDQVAGPQRPGITSNHGRGPIGA